MMNTSTREQLEEHAAVILEAVDGDYQSALDYLEALRPQLGENYTRLLAALLTPAGRC